jgi:RNA polymerase sigma factor (sigma-70 family)
MNPSHSNCRPRPKPRTSVAAVDATELLARYRSGVDHSLDDIMRIYGPVTRAAARSVLSSSADIDDAVQETWIAFVRWQDRIRDPEALSSWLWTITVRQATAAVRRHARNRSLAERATTERDRDEANDVIDRLYRSEQVTAVRSAVSSLSDVDQRLVHCLSDRRELSYQEISTEASRPIGSIGPSRDRIIRKLRANPNVNLFLAS